FADYFAWAQSVMAARGVSAEDAAKTLDCMGEVLPRTLPAELGGVAVGHLDAARSQLPAAPTDPPTFLAGDDALTALARQYLDALLRGQRHAASRLILDAVDRGTAIGDLYLHVFGRCQREVGRLWQLNRISVAQEHYCSAATQLVMSQLYPYLFARPRTGRRLVAACVAGDLHEIGLRVVTDLFELDGWDTLYLGASVPPGGVVQALAEHRAEVLLLSVTMAYHLPAVEELIRAVRSSEATRAVKVVVGGSPFRLAPELWRRVGADGSASDANQALDLVGRLLGLPQASRPSVTENDRKDRAAGGPGGFVPPRAEGEPSLYDEMTRLNSELVTLQRELAKKNAELGRLNEELAEADRRKDEFLAVLAHELRNPLAPLRNALQILQQPQTERAVVGRMHAMMGRQVHQLGRLVEDLLDLTRIARGKLELRPERVGLADVVGRAVEASRPLIESRRHTLTVSLPTPPVRLQADPARLEQVITNLLNNAAKYTEPGGQVWLTAEREGDAVAIRVRDTGIGIPPERLPHVFGLFTQVEGSRERAEGGLGIGLALVKSLAEMHGGHVEARSAGSGQGSEFVVRLPLSPDQLPGRPSSPPHGPPATERALRVLLVDDNADAAESLGMLLRLWGHEVAIAHEGPGAIRAADVQPPEVALLDIGLPGMDGYELARRLRQRPEGAGLLLVALTGWAQEEDRRRTQEAGFDYHLVKPVELDALQKLLADPKLVGARGPQP
ncbi:MAG TPA: ATP-binding protein, partial [Gemmataceae bacterium]|nr:ATP-binding protein [Gemmataceae bacterium]